MVKASFFLTGNFYRNIAFKNLVRELKNDGHYLGPHSDQHLLYCDWIKRDSLLIDEPAFINDLEANYKKMAIHGIFNNNAGFFMPPYEWYNDSISVWAQRINNQLINFTPGTLSNADYTTPAMKNYRSADSIYQSILRYEQSRRSGLNGFILLLHTGTDPARTDKMYYRLPELILYLKRKGYQMVRIDELLK